MRQLKLFVLMCTLLMFGTAFAQTDKTTVGHADVTYDAPVFLIEPGTDDNLKGSDVTAKIDTTTTATATQSLAAAPTAEDSAIAKPITNGLTDDSPQVAPGLMARTPSIVAAGKTLLAATHTFKVSSSVSCPTPALAPS